MQERMTRTCLIVGVGLALLQTCQGFLKTTDFLGISLTNASTLECLEYGYSKDKCLANGCSFCTIDGTPVVCVAAEDAEILNGQIVSCDFGQDSSGGNDNVYGKTKAHHAKRGRIEPTMQYQPKLNKFKLPEIDLGFFRGGDANKTEGDSTSDDHDPRLCDPDVKQHAGYFRSDSGDKNLFYWAFESRNDPQNDPVILWLTGGPGCSSIMALFAENGPCLLDAETGETVLNEYGWNNNATLIYVDQPVGTGFSYGTIDTNEDSIANDMYDFLVGFFTDLPQYGTQDFYIFGESYAGHYIPAISHRIWENQKDMNPEDRIIKLAGIAIGNGLTNVPVQARYYADMAYDSGTAPSRVSEATYNHMKKLSTPLVEHALGACDASGCNMICAASNSLMNLLLVEPYTSTGYNVYDMRKKCGSQPLCYDFTHIARYLNSESVQETLGVEKEWVECVDNVHLALVADGALSYHQLIPDLLESDISVLIYAGDQDYICNWLGNRAWVSDLEWSGKEEWNAASAVPFMVGETEKGKLQSSNGLSFVQVYEAGHMVPMDQPATAFELVRFFTLG